MQTKTSKHLTTARRLPLLLGLTLALGAGPAAATAGPAITTNPVPALDRAAFPLRSTSPAAPDDDLRPLARMVGNASIVGLGEATHSSTEFFTMKHRVFKHLVEEKGFTTFALEVSWSSGLRVNDYVLHGKGNLKQIMDEEFQSSYRVWNNQQYRDLITWMRTYNTRHRSKVQFMGNDIGYTDAATYDRITAYVGKHHPGLLARITALYRESRPLGSVAETMKWKSTRPLEDRRRTTADVRRALALLEKEQPARGAGSEHALIVQHARVIAQMEQIFAYAEEEAPASMLHRDRSMAENTAWWQRQTGHRMLLSAHNGHIAYESGNPEDYPRVQGDFLREMAGSRYTTVGFTFGQGKFNAHDALDAPGGHPYRVFALKAPPADFNEHTLEKVSKVSGRDYYVDLRKLPKATRAWLSETRNTRSIGDSWPFPQQRVALAPSYDVLIHLGRITAADLL